MNGYQHARGAVVALVLSLAAAGGCRHLPPPADVSANGAVGPAMAPVWALYEAGRYDEAMLRWVDAVQGGPVDAEAERVRSLVLGALLEQRARRAEERREQSVEQMGADVLAREQVPGSYGLQRYVKRTLEPHRRASAGMQAVLDTPVSMHLAGADLGALIRAVGLDSRVNIVADDGLGGGKKVNLHLDDVPLREVLDYLSRNFDVDFYVGENLIWAASGSTRSAPLVTRLYRLHHGLQFHTSDWTAAKEAGRAPNPVNRSDLSFEATELPAGKTYFEDLLDRFVPRTEGSERVFDKNTHTLFVRDTPENLGLMEKVIEALDISPPQVLIEARFIEASVEDLAQVGIDWVLNGPWVVNRERVLVDGEWQERPAAQIAGAGPGGAIFQTSPPADPVTGAALRDYGLNLTYEGILTEPMFTAVLHALELAGNSRTLSVPRVTTVNNNPAKLRHGQDLLYYEEFDVRAITQLDADGRKYDVTALVPKGKPVLAELGITLVAVPSVGEDGRTISLLLTPTISRLDEFNYYTDEQTSNAYEQIAVKLPTISRREVQTKVVVQSGETVVMGGLIEVVTAKAEQRIPLLGSLPLIGQLFRRMDETEERRNLIIFVTATVISDRGESILPAADQDAPVDAPPAAGA